MSYPSICNLRTAVQAVGYRDKNERRTYICEFKYCSRLDLHVLVLDLLPYLIHGLSDELVFILLIGTEATDKILKRTLPHLIEECPG